MKGFITILLYIAGFIVAGLALIGILILKYIVPFLIPIVIVTIIALKHNWKGVSVIVLMGISFILLLIGPTLLCTLTLNTKDIHGTRMLSISIAILTIFILWCLFHKVHIHGTYILSICMVLQMIFVLWSLFDK